jgi:hypothetical protein
MATIFETMYHKPLSGTKIQISLKDMNWHNRELHHNRFEHEKFDETPKLTVRMEVPFVETQRISDYVDNFWNARSGAKSKDIKLTNAQLYEYQLRKVIDEAIENLHAEWHTKLEKRIEKMLDTQKEVAE